MLALVSSPTAPYATLRKVADPEPRPHEVLVMVRAFSLNRGEVARLRHLPDGSVTGWDAAGTVVQEAADGTGPAMAARVMGLVERRGGTWAQLAAVPVGALAAIPPSVTYAQAAALPTTGLTALRMLEVAGLVLGKRVLVTGATGGLGRMAVQLAHLAGARVTALVRDRGAADGPLRALGAEDVVDRLAGDFDVVLEGVGGATFGLAIEHLAPGGIVVNVATQDDEETVTFRAARFDRAAGARIYTLNMPDEIARHASGASDLRRLCALVAEGRLDPQVALEDSWRNATAAMEALLSRRVAGKAVLHVD